MVNRSGFSFFKTKIYHRVTKDSPGASLRLFFFCDRNDKQGKEQVGTYLSEI